MGMEGTAIVFWGAELVARLVRGGCVEGAW